MVRTLPCFALIVAFAACGSSTQGSPDGDGGSTTTEDAAPVFGDSGVDGDAAMPRPLCNWSVSPHSEGTASLNGSITNGPSSLVGGFFQTFANDNGDGTHSRELWIRLADHENACAYDTNMAAGKVSGRGLEIAISDDQSPTPLPAFAPETITVRSNVYQDAGTFQRETRIEAYADTCGGPQTNADASGTVTITAIDAQHAAGTFDLTINGQHVTGSFDVPTCAGVAVVAQSCCVP